MATLQRFRLRPLPAFAPRTTPAREARSVRHRLTRRKKARRTVLLGLFWFVTVIFAFDYRQDDVIPHVRDPEYARRAMRWHARSAEQPNRPVVLVLGSSRVAMGVRSAAWEEVRPAGDAAPMILNMSAAGHGPVGQLMFFKRILAEGPPPDAILLEFWPPFLRSDGEFTDEARTDWLRLGPGDHAIVSEYFENSQGVLKASRNARLNPFYEYRYKILNQINARWIQWKHRQEALWQNIDAWGWLPGIPDDPSAYNRGLRMTKCYETYYQKLFNGFTFGPTSDRAFREIIALARERGIRVGLVYLPESEDFRAWYPPEVKRGADEYLARLTSEMHVPVIDARAWLPNDATCDGFHLFKPYAAEFSRRLGPEVMAIFPGLTRRPQ